MICLEVSRDDKRLCLAGLEVGSWSLDLMLFNPSEDAPTLYVAGATPEQDCVEWVRKELVIGETISFRLVEASEPDPPHPCPPPPADSFAEAVNLTFAQDEFNALNKRLRKLRDRWGEQLVESPDA
jgi:hypothetical protein